MKWIDYCLPTYLRGDFLADSWVVLHVWAQDVEQKIKRPIFCLLDIEAIRSTSVYIDGCGWNELLRYHNNTQ